jgi:uncharacterized repeat protein (TIGR03803 family)
MKRAPVVQKYTKHWSPRVTIRLITLACCVALGACSTGSLSSPPIASAPQSLTHDVPAKTKGAYATLYSFSGSPGDGQAPSGSLLDVNGSLYGTTEAGGAGSGYYAGGVVFAASTTGSEQVLYNFSTPATGQNPQAGLVDVAGTLYGTTREGGTPGLGIVYSISPGGTENELYAFKGGADGAYPTSALIDIGGTLYGTTTQGGPRSLGTIYTITTAGAERVIYSFSGADGSTPGVALLKVKGTLYGVTNEGGTNNVGTVFAVSRSGAEHVLYSFQSGTDGRYPNSSLIDVNGTLYGTTTQGGTSNVGTVFAVSTAGVETVAYSFHGGADGIYPNGPLLVRKGTFYGTTMCGGTGSSNACQSGNGGGTIFSLTPSGSEQVLHDFGAISNDGNTPLGPLIDVKSTLYGTTEGGGTSGDGTIFSLRL